jgi:hypothetical protein
MVRVGLPSLYAPPPKGDYVGTSVAIKEVVISEDDEEFARKYIEREVAVLRYVVVLCIHVLV